MPIKNNDLILAPMAGITDSVFRRVCKMSGADVVFSEMVSSEGIVHNSTGTNDLLKFTESERPIGIQIFGADPKHCAYAAAYIQDHASPDFIDLNSGCPVPKVVGKNGGASLLRDIHLFTSILDAVVKAVSIPVTVKIRSGWHKFEWVDAEFAKAAEQCGVSAVTLHPRSQTMGFSGHSYWDRIALVKEAVSIPVIGNGDVTSPQTAEKMLKETGCDAVMIGRAAYGNPWIFRNTGEFLKGKNISAVTVEERLNTVLMHIRMFMDEYGESRAAREMKKHCAWYIHGMPGASLIRNNIFRAGSVNELTEHVVNFFKNVPVIQR